MRKIKISDITLREQANNPERNLTFKQKIEIAKHLDKMKIDVIDTPPIEDKKTDTLLLRTMSAFIKNSTLSVPINYNFDDVETAWNAVSNAKRARLHVMMPVSSIQMEYFCRKKPPVILEKISSLVAECKKYCDDIEFSAEDATRAEEEYLAQAINAAIEAGATTITVCDSEGSMLPEEMEVFVKNLYEKIPRLHDVTVGVQCNNQLYMATACAFAAVKANSGEIKVTVDNDHYPSIPKVSNIIKTRGDALGIECNLNTTQLQRLVQQVTWILAVKQSGDSPLAHIMTEEEYDNFQLNYHDDINAVTKAVADLGYDLSEEDIAKVYDAFVRVAKNKAVGAREMDAIIASVALQVPPTYQLISYVINSGNVIAATANIELEKDGKKINGLHTGDGPIDAAFRAIENVLGKHYELDDFQIQAVTEGKEAMGSALVKLRSGGKLYSGNGISTDIIGASIQAYLNALNKIVYEEN
ncbi:MAG: alpha-isopropylmalate synthase regulatory domain-containing protein [Bacillota bacterium]|jgi:2-isopropylmalate synthase